MLLQFKVFSGPGNQLDVSVCVWTLPFELNHLYLRYMPYWVTLILSSLSSKVRPQFTIHIGHWRKQVSTTGMADVAYLELKTVCNSLH